MANLTALFGFRPLLLTLGGAPCEIHRYGAPASDATAIFVNDVVMKAAVAIPSASNPYGPNIAGCTSGQAGTPGTGLWLGVALNYRAAGVAGEVFVVDTPDALFSARADGTTVISVASHVGKNANLNKSAGSALTKQSGMGVNSSTIAVTAALDLKIQDIGRVQGNAEGANAILEVTINLPQLGTGKAGV